MGIAAKFFFVVLKSSIWSVSCRNIIMVYCAKILVRCRYMLHGHHNFLFGFDQKNALFGVRAEILLSRVTA